MIPAMIGAVLLVFAFMFWRAHRELKALERMMEEVERRERCRCAAQAAREGGR